MLDNEFLPIVKCHFFIFFNPYSGNRQGQQMKEYAGQYIRMKKDPKVMIQMFDITDADDANKGFQLFNQLLEGAQRDHRFILCSAGGDGTFVGIIDNLAQMNVELFDSRLFFTVLGYGTGNDLSQSMGWGRLIPCAETSTFDGLATHLHKRITGIEDYMDLWKVTVVPRTGGYVEKAAPKRKRVRLNGEFTRLMANYITLGLQGVVGTGFEQKRRGSRLLNVFEYAKQCFLRGVVNHVERVPEYLDKFHHNGITYEVNMDRRRCRRMVEIVFQNLPGIWGRKMKLWDVCAPSDTVLLPNAGGADSSQWHKSRMQDGKLDVYGMRTRTDYLFKQFSPYCRGSSLNRFGQFSGPIKIDFLPETKFHMMLDGEFYTMYDIQHILIEEKTKIRILRG